MDEELERGVIWEPRVLWDVQSTFGLPQALNGIDQVRFSRYNLRNGGQYPIEIRSFSIAPVGYSFSEYDGEDDPPDSPLGDYGACAAVLQKASIMISLPNRQHYALSPLQLSTWLQEPTADVSMRYSGVSPGASGLFGVNRWDFDSDRCLVLPRRAACEFFLGSILDQPNTPLSYEAFASLAFYEEGVLHGGSRSFMRNARARVVSRGGISTASVVANHPFPVADGLGAAVGTTNEEWPVDSRLTMQDFRRDETAREGHNKITGFAVAIDQITYDDALVASALGNVAAGRVAPISLRTPCRARCDAFSQESWWRDGAPLALVCPTQSPALTYRFPRPFTLHKGDHIEVEMQLPQGVTIGAVNVFPIYQMGISFAGYAAVEG